MLTENTESYGYDWLDRLTSTTGPWGTITYTYDQVGNRVKMVQGGTPTTYSYGSFNRLTSAGSTTYTYDANGNMVTKNDGTSWTFSYDYENRLTNVVHSGSTVQQNFYDAGGDRVKKTETDTVVYSYQGLNILYEKDLTTGTVTKHFCANGQQVAKMVGSGTFYVHGDHLGSTRLVLTGSLTVAFSSNYVPYGPNYGSSGSEVFMYTDKPYDSVTGLYYFGARFYDPTLGRFVTQDSNSGRKHDPLSLNRYIYVVDNPMKYVDPNGHWVSFPFLWIDGVYAVGPRARAQPSPQPSSYGDKVLVTLFGFSVVVPNLGNPSLEEVYAMATLAVRGIPYVAMALAPVICLVTAYDLSHGNSADYAYDAAAAAGLSTAIVLSCLFLDIGIYMITAIPVGGYVGVRILTNNAILIDEAEAIEGLFP